LSRPTTQREKSAAIGGLTGGAGGALIGTVAGSALIGGLVGLPLGVVAGWYIGDQMEQRARINEARLEETQAETARLRRESERFRSQSEEPPPRPSYDDAPTRESRRSQPETKIFEQDLPAPPPVSNSRRQERQKEKETAAAPPEQYAMTSSYETVMSPAKMRQVQKRLNDMGYNTGQVDGVWGPMTQAAVKNFQQAKNIQATGRLDEQTLNALDIEGPG
jgi:hypothetical protein